MPANDYFSPEALRKDLKRKTIRGGVVTSLAQPINILLHVGGIVVLSRLLDPEAFGIAAITLVFGGLATTLLDTGLASASVQRDDLTDGQASNLFWVSSAFGLTASLLMVAIAQPVGWLMSQPEVAAALMGSSPKFLLAALGSQHSALLRRAMRMTTLSAINLSAGVVGVAFKIGLAWTWQNYWALVVGAVLEVLFRTVALWVASGWRPRGWDRSCETLSMLQFGASLTAAGWINYFGLMSDKALVGAALGVETLGLYERSQKVLLFSHQAINGAMRTVVVPALSRVQTEPAKLASAFYRSARVVTAISVPIIAYAATDAPRLIPLVLGPGWEESALLLRALAPAALFATVNSALAWLFVASGKGVRQLRWQSMLCVTTIAGLAAGVPFGAVGIAIGYSTARVGMLPVGMATAFGGSSATTLGFLRAISPAFLGSAVAAAGATGARFAAPDWLAGEAWPSVLLFGVVWMAIYASAAFALGVHRRPHRLAKENPDVDPAPTEGA